LLLHWASFEILLAFDTELRPGQRLETLRVDFVATAHAPPILARTDEAKCLLDFSQALPMLSVGKEGELFFVRTRSAICKVRLHTLVVMPPLRGSAQPSLYFLLPRRELLLKVLQPLPIHSRLPQTEK
jgi:hypothetical protein